MNSLWYEKHFWRWFIWPISLIYGGVAFLRRVYLQQFKQTHFQVPIIVVGNLTVGGVGKTPLVIALANALQEKGIRVGVVSRGYRAKGKFPREVLQDDNPKESGDEPLLIRRAVNAPVVIAPKRVEAVHFLLEHYNPQVIISDDGLQHYAMGRSIEIVVIDGSRGMGNNMLLPAGPLREKSSRLKSVDFVVVNSGDWPGAFPMTIVSTHITRLIDGKTVSGSELEQPVAAIAGIGNPSRFYKTLSEFNFSFRPYSFPDHHLFEPHHLVFNEKTIVMTEKDAVKCKRFATKQMYFLPIKAELPKEFWDAFWEHKYLKGVLLA